MMNIQQPGKRVKDFLRTRGGDAIGRHQIIVYLLHSVILVIAFATQFLGLSGSQEPLPVSMSLVHLAACLTALSLFLTRKLSVPAAFSIVTLVAQATIVCRFIYFSREQPEHFLQLVLINQMMSLMAVVFLVMSFVKYTPFVVATVSVTAYGGLAHNLDEPALWNFFAFFIVVEYLLCILGELLRRNVLSVQTENATLHYRETALMHAVRLNEREIEGYLRMSRNDHPSADDVDRLFAMLTPKSQRNLIKTVRLYLKGHLMDDNDLPRLLPMLTKTETDVCNLILQGKTMSEIGMLLGKTEKNVGVVRTHIRRKLAVPADGDLRKWLMEVLIDKQQLMDGKKDD